MNTKVQIQMVHNGFIVKYSDKVLVFKNLNEVGSFMTAHFDKLNKKLIEETKKQFESGAFKTMVSNQV